MADNTTASDGASRRKREAPTIDLTAEDVTPPAATPEPAPAEQTADAPPPPEEPARSTAEAEPASGSEPSFDQHAWTGLIAAGVVGGVIVSAVLAALWYGNVLPVGTADGGSGAQIAALQQQIDALRHQPPPPADAKAVDAIAQRVGKIEDVLKTLPKGDGDIADRLAAAEIAMKSLGVALAALNQRSEDAAATAARAREQADAAEKAVTQLRGSVQGAAKDASAAVTPAQIDSLTQRLAALEQAGKAARQELDKAVSGEKTMRLALSASALRAAVTSGAPFAAELAQAKALGAQQQYLAPLAPFAVSGVPSANALTQELRGLLPQMEKLAGAQAPSGGFLERLQANASRLVKITPVDAPPGDDTPAVLARLEVEAAHADVAGALTELGKLPDAIRAPAQAWIAQAKAREAALAAARDLSTATARALDAR